jgi:cytochrome d ubiquinol oxidase subunit I
MGALFMVWTGDQSARTIAHVQPMKFAAMEALWNGKTNVPLVALGILQKPAPPKTQGTYQEKDFYIKIEVPNALSFMAFLDVNAYIPGVKDLVNGYTDGNTGRTEPSYYDKIALGKEAITALKDYKEAVNKGDVEDAALLRTKFEDKEWMEKTFKYFGYGYYDNKSVAGLIPSIPISFYAFRIMVMLSGHFLALFIVMLIFSLKNKLEKMRWLLYIAIWTIPLVYLASQAGWILAEMGRQPWVIQDLMPTLSAVSKLDASSVQITFWLFAITFTTLLIAEVKIMLSQIKKGITGGH